MLGRADPVEVQPVVDALAGVGAEYAIGLEDKEVFRLEEEGVVDPKGGGEGGDLLAGRRHIPGNQCEVELSNPQLVANGLGLVNELHGNGTAYEAEALVGGGGGG